MDAGSIVMVDGDRICLRLMQESDCLGPYLDWLKDSSINQFLESRFSKYDQVSLKDYMRDLAQRKDVLQFAIVVKLEDVHIGNIKLGPINQNHKYAAIGIMIGVKEYWGRGYASEAIRLLSNYAFNELGLNKLTAACYANNRGSIKAFKKAGFRQEGIQRHQFMSNNTYIDGIQLGLLASEHCLQS